MSEGARRDSHQPNPRQLTSNVTIFAGVYIHSFRGFCNLKRHLWTRCPLSILGKGLTTSDSVRLGLRRPSAYCLTTFEGSSSPGEDGPDLGMMKSLKTSDFWPKTYTLTPHPYDPHFLGPYGPNSPMQKTPLKRKQAPSLWDSVRQKQPWALSW